MTDETAERPEAAALRSELRRLLERLVRFMDYDLGFFDHETGRLGSVENPFAAKVLPSLRYKTLPM
jgi:hypothetical protein